MTEQLARQYAPTPASADPTQRILAAFAARHEQLAEAIVAAIWRELPAYAQQTNVAFRDQVRTNALEMCHLVVQWLAEDAQCESGLVSPDPRYTRWRISGISGADLVRGYQIGLAVVWDALMQVTDGDESARGAALELAGRLTQLVMAVMVVHVGTMQDQAARLEEAKGELVDRELVGRLVAGHPPAAGPLRERARRAGLEDGSLLVVVSAQPSDHAAERIAPRDLIVAVTRAIAAPDDLLAVVFDEEVVAVVPVADGREARALALRLRELALTGAGDGSEALVAAGVSTVHPACPAPASRRGGPLRPRAGGERCCVAFCEMTALEYLVSLGDTTAHRMVRASFRDFVRDDLANGGLLVMTLEAYAAADLNATLAAERLHMHVNTMRYRLARIEERADCDVRALADVLELLVAARFHMAPQARSTELWCLTTFAAERWRSLPVTGRPPQATVDGVQVARQRALLRGAAYRLRTHLRDGRPRTIRQDKR